ncbi:MAG: PAS domain S-box protein, partial [Cyclobacteriaceae bacterium]
MNRELEAQLDAMRQKAEEMEQKYRALFESVYDCVVILKENQLLECNPNTLKVFRCTREEFLSRDTFSFSPAYQPDGQPSAPTGARLMREAMEGQKREFEWQYRRADGNLFYAETVLKKLTHQGRECTLVLIKDITERKTAETQLKESETEFRTLADSAPVLLRRTNSNNYFNYFSDQWLRFTGRTLPEEAESGWIDNIHEDDLKNVLPVMDRSFKRRRQYEVTYRLKRHDGVYRWMLDTGIPNRNIDGSFTGYTCAAIDITERRAAENEKNMQTAREKIEARLLNSLRFSDLPAVSANRSGIITFANDSLLKLLGYQASSLEGHSLLNILKPTGELKPEKKSFRELLDRGKFSNKLTGSFIASDGAEILVKFNSLLLNDARNEPAGVTIIAENITEKREVRRELEHTNAFLKEIFDYSNDLIMVFDRQGRFKFINESWKEKLGYTTEQAHNLQLDNLLAPESRQETQKVLNQVSSTGKLVYIEMTVLTSASRKLHLAGSITQSGEGDDMEYRAFLHDLTDRIREEKRNSLYNSIATLTLHSSDLDELYRNIHTELGTLLDVSNFYIALVEGENGTLRFPYYKDQNFEDENRNFSRKKSRGLTEYAIRQQQSLMLYEQDVYLLSSQNEIELQKTIPKVWLGVPLRIENRTIGCISVQSYSSQHTYSQKDLEVLDFVSGQVALAIERKSNEQKISKQRLRLEAIFENSSHLIWSVNRNLEFTSYNRNFEEMMTRQYGVNPTLATDPNREGKVFISEHYHRLWDEKYRQAFMGQSVHFELSFTEYDGRIVWKDVFLNPIYQPNGAIHEISGIGHDITENKRSELALQESEEKFRNIFESFQDIYFRCRITGEVEMVSPSVKDVMLYDPERVIGRNVTNYYLYNKKTKDLIRQLIKQTSVRNFEASTIRQDGKILQFICNVRFIYGPDRRPVAIEGVARDITRLKKTNNELERAKEMAEKSLRVKELFLANMSHEIRTPMNGIIGMIDLLDSTQLSNEQKGYIGTIKKSSQTLLNILNDILDLSKIEAGKMQLRNKPVKLKAVLEKLYALFRQQALSQDVNLLYHIAPDLPPFILVDETRLLQILSNLTSNAIKFTPHSGSVNINLKLEEKKGSNFRIKIEVQDSGIGISPEDQKKLFSSFSQVDNSSTKSFGGTGLGLSISKELCRLMGGDIGVYSTPGFGSTFWFTFMTRETDPVAAEAIMELEEKSAFEKKLDGDPLILLVDDNPVNRKVASEILKKAGCNVDLAIDGEESIGKVQEKQYDLVLMDIQMPHMDGVTATRMIKALPMKSYPPIIAMTAYAMREDKDRFISAGMDDYIAKPVKAPVLIAKVQE